MNRITGKSQPRHALATVIGLAAVATVSAAAMVIAAEGGKLVINGKASPADIRTIGGSAYVRVSDVAKALDMTAVRRSDGSYEFTKAGGANQVQGVEGKVGDTLFTGQWRVTVLSIDKPVDSYAMKSQGEPYGTDIPAGYNGSTRVISPKPGNILVVVHVRAANGQKTPQNLWIARGDGNTALADTDSNSYPPFAYDVDGAPSQTKPILPGAKVDLTMVFVVPQDVTLKDLVFTANNNDSTKSRKGNDVRVHLQ